jgi:hypothetical protein
MPGAFHVRDRLAKAALVVLAALAPLALAASCSTAPVPAPDSESGRTPGCAHGLDDCGGACVDVQSNPQNCGMCGTVCAPGLFCSLGACSDSCAATLTPCGAACVNLQSDVLNCGTCGMQCGAGETCSNGTCACTGQVCAGLCVDVLTNGSHCGGCGIVCAGGQTCSGGVCSGGGSGGSGSGGSAGTGGSDAGTGSGYQIGAMCFPACSNATSDPDDAGVSDGYGYESGRSCIVPGSAPTMGAARCEPPPVVTPDSGILPGDGFYIGGMCHPRCASDATDPDDMGARDGWGYEMGRSCIVVGSAPSMGVPTCVPPALPTGDGWLVDMKCVPACAHPEWVEDAQGYGYEAQQSCVVTGSTAAMQNARCMVMPRTDLPPPGNGFQNGETCFPPCSANATEVDADGYGWEANRTCIVPASKGAVQGVPCVPPPSTVTGDCPRTLSCPVVNSVTLTCGCTWVDGLAERKAAIMETAGATQYFLASAMMETANLTADYPLGDNKIGDAFNAGIAKQNWGMVRRCHPAWNSQTQAQSMTSAAMNSSLALDIQVYTECRNMFGNDWWSGHRNGYNNLGTNTQDIQEFKGAMDWTNTQLTGHLTDDVRFWVMIQAI